MSTTTTAPTAAPVCPDWCETGPDCWIDTAPGVSEALHRHDFDGRATLMQFVEAGPDGTVTEWTVTVDVPTPWGTTMAVQLNADDATRLAQVLTSAAALASEVDQ